MIVGKVWYNKRMNVRELKEELKALNLEYGKMKTLLKEERKEFGIELNRRKQELMKKIFEAEAAEEEAEVPAIDISATGAVNKKVPVVSRGTKHPLMTELDRIVEIYSGMGFNVMSRGSWTMNFICSRA